MPAALRRRLALLAVTLLVISIGVSVYLIATRVLTYNIRNNDVVAHLFQAQIFAMGQMHVPSPPLPQAFDTHMVINDGSMYSKYEPGHAAMLALGMRLGASPKLIVALLAALNAFLIYRIGMTLWGDRAIGITALVILHVSTFYMLASSTLLPHTSLLLWNALFFLAFIHAYRSGRLRDGVLAGLALGAGFFTRPLGALSFAFPALAVLAWRAIGVVPVRARPFLRVLGNRRRLVLLAGLSAAFGLFVILCLLYNRAQTGDMFVLPRQLWDAGDRPYLGFIDTWRDFLHRYHEKHHYVMWFLADHLFPLAMGFQFLVALCLLVCRDRSSLLLVAIILIHPLAFLTYFYYGDYWNTGQIGPRYLFSLMLPLSLMSARVVVELYRRFGRQGRWGHWPVIMAAVFLVGESLVRADLPRWLEHESANTRRRAELRERVLPPAGERALVFVNRRHLGEPDGMFWNHPAFEANVIFARYLGAEFSFDLRRRLYPDRPIYVGKTRLDIDSFLPAWDLLGPFPGPYPRNLDEVPIDEGAPLAPLPPGFGHEWFLYWPALPVVDFATAFGGRKQNAMAYARATITASAPTSVTLRYGSDDGIVLWLNGEELAREEAERAAEFDQGVVEARLLAGENQVLVKVGQGWNLWQFMLRVTDAEGARPPGLVFSTPLLNAPGEEDRGR